MKENISKSKPRIKKATKRYKKKPDWSIDEYGYNVLFRSKRIFVKPGEMTIKQWKPFAEKICKLMENSDE